MPNTIYTDLVEINLLQQKIMGVIDTWVRKRKTPVPRKEIMKALEKMGVGNETVKKSLSSLIKKGYIRRAENGSNTTEFVQIRSV